jgi:hypothetical protein
LGNAARASRQTAIQERNFSWFAFSPAAGNFGACYHVSCPDETTVWLAWVSGDKVQRVVHSVGEVAVEVSGGTEHCFIPISLAPIRVRAGVLFAGIRFDLGNLDGHTAIVIGALKDAAENFRCHIEYLAGKEPAVR